MDFNKNSHLFEPFISILGGKNVLVLTNKEALFNVAYYFQSSRKRLIGHIFTHTFAVVRQINPGLDSPLRLVFIVTTVNDDHRSILE